VIGPRRRRPPLAAPPPLFAGEEKFQQKLQQWYLVVSYSGMRGSLPGCLLSSSSGAERLGLLATEKGATPPPQKNCEV
jgi:hypothetical protein